MFGLDAMRILPAAFALFALFGTSKAHAQTSVQGYGALGSGRYSNRFASGPIGGTVVGGGEVLIGGRFGGAVEVGFDGWVPTVSVDGLIELRDARQCVVPFVRVGLTHSSGEYGNTYNGPNVGAGVNLWLLPRAGLRVEYLHVVQALSGTSGWTENRDLVRVGVGFR
jgi:hypothetical protein